MDNENEFIERQILTTLIINDEYVKAIARVYQPDCLESATAKLLAGWVFEYYSKYGNAPKKDMEGIYTQKLQQGLDKERAGDIEDILSGLSNDSIKQSEEKSFDFFMVQTFEHFHQCQAKAVSQKMEMALTQNDYEEFYKIQSNFNPVDMADAFEDSSINAADLYNEEDKRMEWLVKDFIPTGLTILGGRSKVGKSYFALNMAMGLVQGKRLFGEGADGYKGRKGGILYLALEDTQNRFKRRMREIDPDPNLELLGKNLSPKWRWNKLTHGGLKAIEDWIVKADKPRLVIIDVLARVWSKKSGTGGGGLYAEEYAIYAPLADMAHHYGISIIVLTHTTKGKTQDVFDEILGGMGTQGPCDNLIVLSNVPGRIDQKTLSIRGKDIEEQHLLFETPGGPAKWVYLGEAGEVQKTSERQALYDLLEQEGPLSYPDIRQAVKDQGIGISVNSINTILRKMVGDGSLMQSKRRGEYSVVGMVEKTVNTGIAEKLNKKEKKGLL